ncbi:carbohydrate ABC transporter permease [Vallitalea maricola]|uniref:Carbohydrate ABC transporter permease n=1 Tax=Vallitalea maricola TaxID=3074433 RepID=A0ACB5UNZ1_9FIRM|nr:carbohydrate ABC transporter permease [Vallitalea sp. AN17-2]
MSKKARINAISNRSNVILNVFFIVYSIICVAPVLLILGISFTSENEIILHGFNFIPKEFSLEAYKFLFRDITSIARAYGVSIFATVVGTFLSVLCIALYAYPISRNDFPAKKFFTFYIFFTMLFNGGLVSTYFFNTQVFHMKNTIYALIIPLMMSPFSVLIVRTFYQQSVPKSILESAKIDGASEFRIFYQMVLPLSKPAIATIALFDTLTYWNDWFSSLLYISDKKLYTLQYTMYTALMNVQYLLKFGQNSSQDIGLSVLPKQTVRFAMVLIAIGPIALAYPYFQKYFVKGLTIGSIKG